MTANATHMMREINEIPDATARLLDASGTAIAAAGRDIRARDPRFLVTVARGSSDHVASFMKYAVELTAGIPVASVGPSVASIYGARLRLAGSACLAISQSGKSPDIVAMAEEAKRGGALTVALTNTADSPLARASDHAIDIAAGVEKSVAATKTFVNSAVAGLALLAHCIDDQALLAALAELPQHFRKAIDCDWMQLAGALDGANSLFILGRGPSFAIANEAALKFKETCGVHAEAYSAAEVMHGPLALVTPGFPGAGACRPRPLRTFDGRNRRGAPRQAGGGVHHQRSHQECGAAALRGHRPPAYRSAGADRLFLRLRRGFRPPSRPQSGRTAEPEEGDRNPMSELTAFSGARIFDGEAWHDNAALIAVGDTVETIASAAAIPAGARKIELDGGMLVPGFVDLQVNGGGGLMLNDRQDVETIRTICAAHAPFGTTALLPTLITDTREITDAAVEAGAEAARQHVPGFLGLHLEGPHLSVARKGAHDPALIRRMSDVDEAALDRRAPEGTAPADHRRAGIGGD